MFSIGEIHEKFAFLPLIADPDNGGKTQLFHSLNQTEAKLGKENTLVPFSQPNRG